MVRKFSQQVSYDPIDYRIMLAKGKFQELKKVICKREISLKTRALQTSVRSRLLY